MRGNGQLGGRTTHLPLAEGSRLETPPPRDGLPDLAHRAVWGLGSMVFAENPPIYAPKVHIYQPLSAKFGPHNESKPIGRPPSPPPGWQPGSLSPRGDGAWPLAAPGSGGGHPLPFPRCPGPPWGPGHPGQRYAIWPGPPAAARGCGAKSPWRGHGRTKPVPFSVGLFGYV